MICYSISSHQNNLMKKKEELPDQLISEYEKEYLGFYISKHPVEKEFNKKQYLTIYKLSNAKTISLS